MRMLCFLWIGLGALNAQVVDTTKSPHVKLHPVPVSAVKMGEGFWKARMRVNVERSLPTMLDQLEQHGVMDNFRRLTGKKNAPRLGKVYTDSDIYKWLEAAAFVLQSEPNPALEAKMDSLIDEIVAVQEPSGYLNTFFVDDKVPLRFTEMQRSHELYNLGHMLQAAVAYDRARGKRKLLDAGIRYVNFLVENFGPDKRAALTGHPELEMALVELYRTTGDRHYLDFAGYLLSGVERERLKLTEAELRYMFSGKPFTSRDRVEGHAVRAMYACSGATDYYAETGDPAYRKTLETLWRDMTASKLYLTGGVGSRAQGEAFGEPYELPNAQAYTESCAAIANMMWNWRMLGVTGESRFADVIERALYNGINSGMSLDGTLYCYRNPLESRGEKIRNPWYDTTCCPPNLERTLASLPGYLYSTSAAGVYVHFYHTSELDWKLETGAPLKVRQTTEYPWSGNVEVAVEPAAPAEFSLFLRIPAWSGKTAVTVNGQPVSGVKSGEYLEIRRGWKAGDRVKLAFDVRPRLTEANPLLRENLGRVAVERGPLVYCMEKADNPSLASIFDVSLTAGKEIREQKRADLLGGVVALLCEGAAARNPLTDESLYNLFGSRRPVKPAELVLIPYYAWANRGVDEMQVWIPSR